MKSTGPKEIILPPTLLCKQGSRGTFHKSVSDAFPQTFIFVLITFSLPKEAEGKERQGRSQCASFWIDIL